MLINTHIKNYTKLFFCSILDKLSQTYNYSDEETVAGILWGYGTQECMGKKDFIQCLEVEFEGKTYNAPINYNQYLTQLYSNYMELPPEEKELDMNMRPISCKKGIISGRENFDFCYCACI